jgi:hypothetical protein
MSARSDVQSLIRDPDIDAVEINTCEAGPTDAVEDYAGESGLQYLGDGNSRGPVPHAHARTQRRHHAHRRLQVHQLGIARRRGAHPSPGGARVPRTGERPPQRARFRVSRTSVTQGGPVPAQQVGVVLQRLGDRLRSLRVRLPELPDLHQPFPGQFHDPPTSPSWKRMDAGGQTASTCRGSEAPGAASPAKNACLRTSVLMYLAAYACGAGRRGEAAAPGCAEYVAQCVRWPARWAACARTPYRWTSAKRCSPPSATCQRADP